MSRLFCNGFKTDWELQFVLILPQFVFNNFFVVICFLCVPQVTQIPKAHDPQKSSTVPSLHFLWWQYISHVLLHNSFGLPKGDQVQATLDRNLTSCTCTPACYSFGLSLLLQNVRCDIQTFISKDKISFLFMAFKVGLIIKKKKK